MFGVMVPAGMTQTTRESTIKSSSATTTTAIRQGGSNFMSKIFGNKTTSFTSRDTFLDTRKQSEEIEQSEKYTQSEDHEQRAGPTLNGIPTSLITACPFIRPLEHTLQARSEPSPKPRIKSRSIDIKPPSISASSITRNREEAHRILNGRILIQHRNRSMGDLTMTATPSPSVAGESTMESVAIRPFPGEEVDTEADIAIQIVRRHEYVAILAAENSNSLHHWRYYIDCYSKGQFKLNAPPQSPPRSSSFEYLPAVFPPQEEQRLLVARSYDVVWPRWSRGKASALMCAAMKEFNTVCASLSFFDGMDEVFKAETGYNVDRISRSISIAAHALLSDDVFVVLDTKQDWRFGGNPLVQGNPSIRFFAAAPMLSPSNQAVGVFAVFSKEPRAIFTASQRHELASYSAMVLTDLTQQMKLQSDSALESLRSTPLLQRDSAINGEYQTPKNKAPAPVEIDHALVPPGLRYCKANTPPTQYLKGYQARTLSPEAPSEQTPPSSSEGSEDETFPGVPKGYDKNHKQLSICSDLNYFAPSRDLITPDSEDFRVPTPRPFSASDLTSLNPHPPNTPVLSSQEITTHDSSDLTVENFLSLSDNDCAEQESPLIDLSTPETITKEKVKSGQNLSTSSSRLTGSSISTMMTSESQRVNDPLAEAAFSCSASAQSLGYDLIYVVEIKPSRPFMTDNELFAPGGLHKRIVVAYGLDRPMELATEMHLNVLRSRGVQIWENRDATFDNGEFLSGYLLPLPTERGPHRKRSSGLVFGAFKRPKLVEVGPPDKITAEEMTKLMDAANTLRDILLKQPNAHRIPKRANTEPPSQEGYLANEAVELKVVGRHSLADNRPSSPNRYAANGAAEAGKHLFDRMPYRYPADKTDAVRKHLLDDTPERYPANEAHEVQVKHYPTTRSGRSSPNPYIANEAVEVGKYIVGQIPYSYPSTENELVEVERHPFDQRTELYPGYPSDEAAEAEEVFHDSGIDYTAPACTKQEASQEDTVANTAEKSEPTMLDRKPFSFRLVSKLEKAGKLEPVSPDRKQSKGTTSSKTTAMSQPASPDKKTAKALKAAAKAEKEKAKFLDAGLDRPFHAVARFRPF